MQAIVTKYLGPTNYHGARVKAKAQAGSLTLPWDNALDIDDNHEKAARALALRHGWLDNGGKLVGGGLPDGSGNAYVFTRCD